MTSANYTDAPEEPTGGGGKRRRISLACSACRTRKSRCDGVRPKCSGCVELGFECVYVNPASSSNVIIGREYLTGLEDRLKAVEQDVKDLKGKRATFQLLPSLDEEPSNPSIRPRDGDRLHGNMRSEEVEVNSDELQDSFGEENIADGMGAMVFSAEEDCGFFGPSSNIAFTRHISRAIARSSQSGFAIQTSFSPGVPLDNAVISISQPASPLGRNAAARRAAKSAPDNVNIHLLPSEAKTRNLIARYFGDTGLLFPYIYEQAFLDTYNETKANDFTKVRRTWLGLLNMIMAMATSTTIESGQSAENRGRDSDVYYQRAAGLCEKQIMRGTSLEIVQYLLLTGQYLQGTQRSVEAWTVHGLAVKGALQLGLHSNIASSRFSSLDQEFRKRTWYGCVVLDRTLSMTFGRPAAIPDDYIRIPLPQYVVPRINDGTHGINEVGRQEVSVAFFNATITLYKIMWNVINQLYGSNIGCGGTNSVLETISQLFAIEQQLAGWERQLPQSLNLFNVTESIQNTGPTDPDSVSLSRFRIILKLRHNNVRILLHRPILTKFLDLISQTPNGADAQEAILMQQIGSNSIQVCVQSSIDIISIVRDIVTGDGDHRSQLGAWWFSLYYTFNAALVIFASLLILRDRIGNGILPLPLAVSELELQNSLVDAARALRLLDRDNRMVDRCAAYLEQLAIISAALAPGLDVPPLSNTFGETPASSLHAIYQNNQIYESGMMNASPLGMELGEFLLEGDLEFLNQIACAQQAQGMNKANESAAVGGVQGFNGGSLSM